MRVTYEGRRDRAYVYLTEFDDGDIARQYQLVEHDVGGDFLFEFDKKGRLLGFEVKFASFGLPPQFLLDAERV